jgi:hypothetical protein
MFGGVIGREVMGAIYWIFMVAVVGSSMLSIRYVRACQQLVQRILNPPFFQYRFERYEVRVRSHNYSLTWRLTSSSL